MSDLKDVSLTAGDAELDQSSTTPEAHALQYCIAAFRRSMTESANAVWYLARCQD